MLHIIGLFLTLAIEPSLDGSTESQMRQNEMADRLGLERFRDRAALKRAIRKKALVPIARAAYYELDSDIGSADRGHASLYLYAKPWVQVFYDFELRMLNATGGILPRVTSIVRTDVTQRRIRRGNRNAIRGSAWWMRSSHLTGSTFDISYVGWPAKTVRAFGKRLLALERAGLIEATQEHYREWPVRVKIGKRYKTVLRGGGQDCFHIMVFPRYATARLE